MAIDEPLDQAQALVESDRRQGTPGLQMVTSFAEVFAQIKAALASGNPVGAISQVASAVRAISELFGESNSEYLQSIVISELGYLRGRFTELEEEHQRFLDTDWPSLWVDADRKARATRAQKRVWRIAHILCNAAETGPEQPADYTEELMRVAMHLSESDIAVLREIQAIFNKYGELSHSGWSDDETTSIGAKLESLGLVLRFQPDQWKPSSVDIKPYRYSMLQKGRDFIRFIDRSSRTG